MQPVEVYVYRNLRKKCWSVKSCESGRVIAHVQHAYLIHCELHVSERGRKRVLERRRKAVHAGVRGLWVPSGREVPLPIGRDVTQITYDPYKYDSFVVKRSGRKITYATIVWLEPKRVMAWRAR